MKLFVGLGNPGAKYAKNRHNAGFMAVDRIWAEHGFSPWRRRFQAETAEGRLEAERILLLKPETYMNESGRAVGEAARYLGVAPADIIVFYDEIDLAPGRLKVKTGGGDAGHNGLRSLTAHLGPEYVRVRIGVGHPGVKELVATYVLSDFAKADTQWLEPLLEAIAKCAGRLATGDQARFLSEVARRIQPAQEKPGAAGETGVAAAPGPPRGNRALGMSGAPGTPQGERAAKRQTALAGRLAKWRQAAAIRKTTE